MADDLAVEGLVKRWGADAAVDGVDLAIAGGQILTLLGPSGCGKTTTLRCIAGLERPDAGRITAAGVPLTDAARGIHLPPERREVGMVFQSYAIWPHMTVAANVAYPLEVRRWPRARLAERVAETLRLVGLERWRDQPATRLSGGQQQRVALARALVFRPRLLLFDEPLSNLDARLREQLRGEIVRLQREVGITAVYVTHDQAEAMVIADRIVVMNRGRVEQTGDARAIYGRPANRFVAEFIGLANLVPARVTAVEDGPRGPRADGPQGPRADGPRGPRADGPRGPRADGWLTLAVELGAGGRAELRAAAPTGGLAAGVDVLVSIRPEDVVVAAPGTPGPNRLDGVVTGVAYLGSRLEARVDVGGLAFRIEGRADAGWRPGERVGLVLPESACVVLPTGDGARSASVVAG